MNPLTDEQRSVANAQLHGQWMTETEYRRYQKADLKERAESIFKRFEGLLFHGHTSRFKGQQFTAADGRSYSIVDTLRSCEQEVRAALKGSGPGLAAAERDLPAIEQFIAQSVAEQEQAA